MKWKPALYPAHRSPRSGWAITEMPAVADDSIRRAWLHRTKRVNNKNGHQAVEEMVMFLMLQRVHPTKDDVLAIQQAADREWCSAEPSRCPKTARVAGGKLVRQANAVAETLVKKAVAQTHGGGTVIRKRRSCCGG